MTLPIIPIGPWGLSSYSFSKVPATVSYDVPDGCGQQHLRLIFGVQFNTIASSTPGSSKSAIAFLSMFLLSNLYHKPQPPHPSWPDQTNNIWRGENVLKLITMHFSPFFCQVNNKLTNKQTMAIMTEDDVYWNFRLINIAKYNML